jgi:hypothetical protein
MRSNTFCYSVCTALLRDRGPISLQGVSICIIQHCIAKRPVAFAQGTSVPIFNGSPPLS